MLARLPTVLLVVFLLACESKAAPKVPALVGPPPDIEEELYTGALKNGWLDFGWSPRELGKGPATVDLSEFGGWILGKQTSGTHFGGLRFKVSALYAEGVEVRLDGKSKFPRVSLDQLTPISEVRGFREYFIPMAALNPKAVDFEQLVFQGKRKGAFKGVQLDDVGLTARGAAALSGPVAEASFAVDCSGPGRPVSLGIYGVAFDPQRPQDDTAKVIGATGRRWGGNLSTRYNWQLGNAWNTASDWYFKNVDYTGLEGYSYETFLGQQRDFGLKTALTVPMLGFIAKDKSSCGFPQALFAQQQHFENAESGCGNGLSPDGRELKPGTPSLTSIPGPPSLMGEWVQAIRTEDAKGRGRSVHLYFLDNEPNLWSQTHRDVHPEPLTYDELWEKSLALSRAIRKADPDAIIAGPAEWGWTNYFDSAADIRAGGLFGKKDRKAHENLPLIAWYLKKAAEHEKKTGERVIDVLDLHYYPQGKGIGIGSSGNTDPETNALRIRSTRSLWDPSYRDESWIGDQVRLLPRMREWIDQYYPGRGISIGEYNFGADTHPSGGLAQAEALGHFAQEGVGFAYVWYYPPKKSAGAQAFQAFRNYDGQGGRFLDTSLPTRTSGPVALFASRDVKAGKLVLVALNEDPVKGVDAPLDVGSCGKVALVREFQTVFGAKGLEQLKRAQSDRLNLPPYSLTVIELTLATPDGAKPGGTR
ncbi:MAG: glycoside hydrolase family 44 protein [Myxococcaceae bacterium]|nr:glycoside hydrolase family 44 protein [Myxococcaceae bacterium]